MFNKLREILGIQNAQRPNLPTNAVARQPIQQQTAQRQYALPKNQDGTGGGYSNTNPNQLRVGGNTQVQGIEGYWPQEAQGSVDLQPSYTNPQATLNSAFQPTNLNNYDPESVSSSSIFSGRIQPTSNPYGWDNTYKRQIRL